MSHSLDLRPRALQELGDAITWYERQQTGLGRRFSFDFDQLLADIAATPLRWAIVHRDIRQALVTGWPYFICFRIVGNTIRVIAVYNTFRNSQAWKRRT